MAFGAIRGDFGVSINSVKANFFNPTPLINALDRAEAKFMARFGAYVRSDANRSMRRSKTGRPSRPGSPPNVHVGLLRKFNFFSYDKRAHNVVIGPVRLQNTRYPVPGLMEYGGTAQIRVRRNTFTTRRTRSVGTFVPKIANYPERPFMRPALQKNLKRVNELRDSVK